MGTGSRTFERDPGSSAGDAWPPSLGTSAGNNIGFRERSECAARTQCSKLHPSALGGAQYESRARAEQHHRHSIQPSELDGGIPKSPRTAEDDAAVPASVRAMIVSRRV